MNLQEAVRNVALAKQGLPNALGEVPILDEIEFEDGSDFDFGELSVLALGDEDEQNVDFQNLVNQRPSLAVSCLSLN